jgi:DNA invertase Pin-like site-specific DNA recombinase
MSSSSTAQADDNVRRPLRLLGYLRVSRIAGRSGESFISREEQRATVEHYAAAHGHIIVGWHEDLDVSGGTLERPGLDAVLAAIKAGEVDGLAVAKLDRLSRAGVGDALKLVEEILGSGGVLVAVDLNLDPTTTGEMVLTVLLALGRMERRRIADGWKAAKSRALDRGAKIGPTPYGYRRQKDGTLDVEPEAAGHVREAFRLARGGVPPALDYLAEHAAGRTWSAYTVRRLLANRSYLGEQHYGDEVRRDVHEALVTRAAWELAQHEPTARRRPPAAFPLSGVATCAGCGGPMVGGRGGTTKDGAGLRTYRCAASLAKTKGDRCPAPATMVATRLEGYVAVILREWAATHGAPVIEADEVNAEALDAAASVLAEAEEELRLFATDPTARRALGADLWAEALEERARGAEEARLQLRDVSAAQGTATRVVDGLQALDTLTPEEWGQLVAATTDSVTVARGRGPVESRVRLVPLWETEAPLPRGAVGAIVGEATPLDVLETLEPSA